MVGKFGVRYEAPVVVGGSGAQRETSPRLQRVVLSAVVVRVEKLLEPLQKLKIVLEPALDQFIYRNNLQFGAKRHLLFRN